MVPHFLRDGEDLHLESDRNDFLNRNQEFSEPVLGIRFECFLPFEKAVRLSHSIHRNSAVAVLQAARFYRLIERCSDGVVRRK